VLPAAAPLHPFVTDRIATGPTEGGNYANMAVLAFTMVATVLLVVLWCKCRGKLQVAVHPRPSTEKTRPAVDDQLRSLNVTPRQRACDPHWSLGDADADTDANLTRNKQAAAKVLQRRARQWSRLAPSACRSGVRRLPGTGKRGSTRNKFTRLSPRESEVPVVAMCDDAPV